MLTRALHACGLLVHGDRTDCTVCGLATGRVWAQWVPFPGDPLDLVPIAEAASSLEDFAELLAAGSEPQ